MSVFDGLRVVEVSATGAAGLGTKYLSDWGAEVVVLEPAGGTPLRDTTPWFESGGERKSGRWEWLSRGKRVVTGLGQAEARALCEAADVLILEKDMVEEVLGIAPRDVRAWAEGRVTCVLISALATDGPYGDYEVTDIGTVALGGWMWQLGAPGREPLRPGGDLIWRISGLYAAVGTALALRHLREGGRAQFVDISEQAIVASMTVAPWIVKELTGVELARRGNFFPMGTMECQDGWVGCAPLTETHWEMMCHWMGIGDVLDEPGAREPNYRVEHGPELYQRIRPWLAEHTRMEIFETAQEWRLPSAPVQTVAERLEDPHLKARGFWQEIEIDGRPVRTPRVTYSVAGIDPVVRGRRVEGGEAPEWKPRERAAGGAGSPEPFKGLRVLDLTWFWSGPSAAMLMGALGADVIKIESIQRPDPYRFTWAPGMAERFYEKGPLWHDCNANKRDITLDLNNPDGMSVFEKLVREADVVISNFSNRVLPNLGLTVERFHELNPRLIVITCPGYGMGGPWEDYIGYGVAFEQLAVCASITGYADGPPSIMGGFCDPVVGLHAVLCLELALQYRERTGKGTACEVPQCETLDGIWAPEHIAVQMGAAVPARQGNRHPAMAPHNAYQAAGDENWVTIVARSDEEFATLAAVLGKPELAEDARFATLAARKESEPDLDAEISALTRGWEARELEKALQASGVAAARLLRGLSLPEDEGFQHLRFFEQVTRAASGTYHQKMWPWRFSDLDLSIRSVPPTLGEHNREVLSGVAGLRDDEIAQLERDRVIGTVPVMFAE